jgi:transcriptional regulator with XRE-family HTH domain
MPPIGETLREARMRQKLDIADVEERTKIRAKYLRALENEEWGLLPGPTFVKTFLRTYAEVVGIDPHLLVEEYRVNHERGDEPEIQALAPMPRDRRRGGRRPAPRPPRRGMVLVAAAGALLAFLLALGLLGGSEDDGGGGQSASTPTETAPTPTAKPRKQAPKAAPTGVNVRIAPREATYACVDTGPGTDVVYEGTLDAPRTFRDPRQLRLNLGKRSAGITLNGDPVEVAESAEPLGLALDRDGSSELASGDRPCA